jgi:hypothetical protein
MLVGVLGIVLLMGIAWIATLYRAVRDVVEIRCGAISGNMKVSFQAARSIG